VPSGTVTASPSIVILISAIMLILGKRKSES
jgi:hypothetical protein